MSAADNIFKNLTVLYEMALSIGQSLELEKNCDNFLKILLARKNLSYAAVWLREDKLLPQGHPNQLQLSYGKPRYFIKERSIKECERLREVFQNKDYLSITEGSPYFQDFVHENNIKSGTYVIFPLSNLGYLKLYSVQAKSCFFDEKEIKQLDKVFKKFAISLEGCISHQKMIKEVEERKKAEEELSQLNETLADRIDKEVIRSRQKDVILQRNARQAAMGEIINSIAHQWRQPLNSISLAASNILIDLELGEDEEQIRKSCDFILQRAEDMSGTITDFMDFFRHDQVISDIDIEALLIDIGGMLQAQLFSSNIKLEWHIQEGFKLKTYKKEIQQVLLNLITNAIQAFDGLSKEDKKISLTIRQEGSYIIELYDNAGGIAEDIINKIFDPYFTTKEKGHGTGLGLSICKNIIEAKLHGEIQVQNIDGGALFQIILPESLENLND
ncbi:HAMP domain-containing histidine kinase [Heliorestis acidaminivorans]|uniref:histidine kinase n=1 Tax=Heliorestis acidaminivorans TaxID=553427 RepID=A0A6I0F195_9FIRM|nr:HAMP domain-containing sensor histidine kinase [Heliorestis acidaminivorans]KAB2952114.1 HAMP domain-containing histidine kinase [Heliorestis acidaminivorans]